MAPVVSDPGERGSAPCRSIPAPLLYSSISALVKDNSGSDIFLLVDLSSKNTLLK